MRLGHGTFTTGRWWFYLDTDQLTIGRTATTEAVRYTVLGVVLERLRPAGYLSERAITVRRRQIRKWQGVRNLLWRLTEYQLDQREGEPAARFAARRMAHLRNTYNVRAADARARGEDVPTIDELRAWGPTGIPEDAYITY